MSFYLDENKGFGLLASESDFATLVGKWTLGLVGEEGQG